MEKINVVFGTAGHIDHGKTTLLKALTGIDADRLVLEKELGITIDIGFAPWITDKVNMGFVDVPGHEKYVRNMVVGVSGIDGVLLVVAADEGVMPQTIEHVDICSMLDIKNIVVAITKIDLVSQEDVERRIEEVKNFLLNYNFKKVEIVAVSGVTKEGIDNLKDALLRMASYVDRSESSTFPRLNIDRVFKLKGIGVVVTGTTLSGKFSVGDTVEILPIHRKCKIRNIQVYERDVKEAVAGQRTALNLSGIEFKDLKRGYSITTPDIFDTSQIINVKIKCSKNFDKGIKDGLKVHFYGGTDNSIGKIYFPENVKVLESGRESFSQIRLEKPLFLLPCDKFIVRQYSPEITIGGGKIVEILSKKLRKKELSKRIDIFIKFENCNISDFILFKFRDKLFTIYDVIRYSGKDKKMVEGTVNQMIESGMIEKFHFSDRTYFIEKNFYQELLKKIEDMVFSKGDGGIKKENLQFESKISDDLVFAFLIDNLLKNGTLFKRKNLLFHKKFAGGSSEFLEKVRKFIRNKRFEGVSKEELFKRFGGDSEEALNILISNEKIFTVDKNYFIDSEIYEKLVRDLKIQFGEKGEFSVGEFKNITGLTRKKAIPLLEFLDRKGITLRFGNVRKLKI